MKITKAYIVLGLVFVLLSSFKLNAERMPSETLDGRKGLFHLISADVNDESAYFFRTSMEYFQDSNLLKDQRDATGTKATIAFGYALFPELLLTGMGGFRVATLETGGFKQDYVITAFQLGATGTFDLGRQFNMEAKRLMAGASLMIDFSKAKRIFKGLGFQPRLMLTTDYADMEPVGVRAHLNLGFNPAVAKRYFDPSKTNVVGPDTILEYQAFDYFAYNVNRKMGIPVGLGVELPFWMVTPSVEGHWEYVFGSKFNDQPKYVTVGLKTRPFPQKNIEIFGGADIGLTKYKRVSDPDTIKPKTHPVPLWNAILGFGISQFGKKPNEVEIDASELNKTREHLKERNEMISALRLDLAYNTVTGRVIDAETKVAMSDVTVSFPEQANIRQTVTNDKGEFTRYFPNLAGSRIVFSKEGYADSTKFLALKPGEAIRVDIQMTKGGLEQMGDVKVAVTNDMGAALAGAEVFLVNLETRAESKAVTDATGNIALQIAEGEYSVEIRAQGFVVRKDNILVRAGSAVIRAYQLTAL